LSGRKREGNELVENSEPAAAFKRAFEARFASAKAISEGGCLSWLTFSLEICNLQQQQLKAG
jgi:hypothetical protein